MTKHILIVATLMASSVTGCAESTKQAPGTMPGDMSQEAHLQEAAAHDAEAAQHEREAKRQPKVPPKMMHSKKADKESDIAEQHRKAAEDAE